MRLALDLQTHTRHSPDCGWMSPRSLVEAAAARGLDGVAVTDHNTTGAVAAARRHAPEGLLVVPGVEIDTRDGQVLGLFVEERIEPGGSAAETIGAIQDGGGLAVAPHPFDRFRSGLGDLDPHTDALDAVEALNARCVLDRDNRRAASFAAAHGLPAVGGSDGHFRGEVGAAYTVVDVAAGPDARGESVDSDASNDPDAIVEAIRAGRTTPAGARSSRAYHAGTLLVKRYNRIARALGRRR